MSATKAISAAHRLRINAVLDYWFPQQWDRVSYPGREQILGRWFGRASAARNQIDADIKQRFEEDYERHMSGEYEDWRLDKDGRLASMILLDQYSRFMFRNTAKGYEAEPKALELCLQILDNRDVYDEYTHYEKSFLLLPLQHSEDQNMTRRCIEEAERLQLETRTKHPNESRSRTGLYLQMFVQYSQDCDGIISRFGRYPFRNRALGRQSTFSESCYLTFTWMEYG